MAIANQDLEELAVSRLTRARKRQKLTQEEIAEKLGISNTQLSRYEKGGSDGGSKLSVSAMILWARAVGMTPAEVLAFEDTEVKTERQNVDTIVRLKEENESMRQAIAAASRALAI